MVQVAGCPRGRACRDVRVPPGRRGNFGVLWLTMARDGEYQQMDGKFDPCSCTIHRKTSTINHYKSSTTARTARAVLLGLL